MNHYIEAENSDHLLVYPGDIPRVVARKDLELGDCADINPLVADDPHVLKWIVSGIEGDMALLEPKLIHTEHAR